MDVLNVLATGWLDAKWWHVVFYTLGTTHVTIVSVTIFLHRAQAHRALTLHPGLAHFFRFSLWLTTGMVTREWVAIHRKHHAKCETKDDPHSPQTRGIKTVLWKGTELYRAEAAVTATLEKYGEGTPDDWVERHLYGRHVKLGIGLLLFLDVILFGAIGLTIWAVQMAWIPVMAAGIINGLGHYWGYRNFHIRDSSTNISPWGILIGGEELHNNHHTYPTSAKLSVRSWEFDLGWCYISLFEKLGLATVRKTPPRLRLDRAVCGVPDAVDLEAVIASRHELAIRFRKILRRNIVNRELYRKVRHFRRRLEQSWNNTKAKKEELEIGLVTWCQDAGKSGIPALEKLAWKLPGYRLRA